MVTHSRGHLPLKMQKKRKKVESSEKNVLLAPMSKSLQEPKNASPLVEKYILSYFRAR